MMILEEMFADCPRTVHWAVEYTKASPLLVCDSTRLDLVFNYPAQIAYLQRIYPGKVVSSFIDSVEEKRGRKNIFSKHAKDMSEMLDQGKSLIQIAEFFSTVNHTLRYYYCRKVIDEYRSDNHLPPRVQRLRNGPQKEFVRTEPVKSRMPEIEFMMSKIDPNTGQLYLAHRISVLLCMNHGTVASCVRQIRASKKESKNGISK
jgi:hypothetical protein